MYIYNKEMKIIKRTAGIFSYRTNNKDKSEIKLNNALHCTTIKTEDGVERILLFQTTHFANKPPTHAVKIMGDANSNIRTKFENFKLTWYCIGKTNLQLITEIFSDLIGAYVDATKIRKEVWVHIDITKYKNKLQ